jgi:hypothetical protein
MAGVVVAAGPWRCARAPRPALLLLITAPLIVAQGQDQVTTAPAKLAGRTSAFEPQHIDLMADAGLARALPSCEVSAHRTHVR